MDSSQLDPAQFKVEPALGRNCGSCTLCCKVFEVPVLEKPAGSWCKHCQPGKGCGIWETRPDHCRAFYCLWMTQSWLAPEWKPDISKIVITVDPATGFLLFQVDPGSANAWKREPYYSQIKRWSAAYLAKGLLCLVFVNKAATVVLPDRDQVLGVIPPGGRILTRERLSSLGATLDVEVVAG